MYLPFSPASSSLHYQQSLSPPDSTHLFLHRCMHSEPQRCFRLQPLRTFRKQFVHYYSASYLSIFNQNQSVLTVSIFLYVEHHTTNHISLLQYRKFSFYGALRDSRHYRHLFGDNIEMLCYERKDNLLTISKSHYRHLRHLHRHPHHAL